MKKFSNTADASRREPLQFRQQWIHDTKEKSTLKRGLPRKGFHHCLLYGIKLKSPRILLKHSSNIAALRITMRWLGDSSRKQDAEKSIWWHCKIVSPESTPDCTVWNALRVLQFTTFYRKCREFSWFRVEWIEMTFNITCDWELAKTDRLSQRFQLLGTIYIVAGKKYQKTPQCSIIRALFLCGCNVTESRSIHNLRIERLWSLKPSISIIL